MPFYAADKLVNAVRSSFEKLDLVSVTQAVFVLFKAFSKIKK